ncbi:MAG: VOC family protein [Pseudomonadota bacterium]|nr:VOC family protein [Pseudomonadota bacterium]
MFNSVHLDHIVLRANNAEVLSSFYIKVLKCEIERELPIGLIQLRLGSILIDIVEANSELGRQGGPPPGKGRNMDHFCLKVEPFEQIKIVEHLNRCAVKFEPVRELYGADGFGPSIYLYDPEGNKIELKG